MSPFASYLLQTTVTLLAVVALAVLVLVAARRLGVGRPAGPMQLLGRLPLDTRRTLYLVRVADRVLVLGVSEAGLTRLAQMKADNLPVLQEEPSPPSFARVLARLRAGTQGGAPARKASQQQPAKDGDGARLEDDR